MKPQRRILFALFAVFAVVGLGTAGYVLIEHCSTLDGLYMTVITITTVGFKEVAPLSSWGQIFTMLLIITGFVCLTFFAHSFVEAIMEQTLSGAVEKKKMRKQIGKLREHQIICGFGRVGRSAAEEFRRGGCDFVVIESQPAGLEEVKRRGFPHILGDAVSEETLIEAGIERAKGLLAILPSDADNLFVTLTAREINPSIRIVARVEEASSCKKILRAGADRVISPFAAAGVEFAHDLIEPHSGEDAASGVEVAQTAWISVANRPELVGKPIGVIGRSLRGEVVGLRRDGQDILCPNPRMHAEISDQLLLLEHIFSELGEEETNSEHVARVCVAVESTRIATQVAKALRRTGCFPLIAKSGKSALSVISSHRPDVALIDQGFHDLPGEQIIRRVRSQHPECGIKFVLMTDDEESQIQERVDAQIPFDSDPSVIVATMQELIQRPLP